MNLLKLKEYFHSTVHQNFTWPLTSPVTPKALKPGLNNAMGKVSDALMVTLLKLEIEDGGLYQSEINETIKALGYLTLIQDGNEIPAGEQPEWLRKRNQLTKKWSY